MVCQVPVSDSELRELLRQAICLVGNRDIAEDIVQQVLEEALRDEKSGFLEHCPSDEWLKRRVRSRCIDYFRRRVGPARKIVGFPASCLLDFPAPSYSKLDTEWGKTKLRQVLAAILKEMNPQSRKIILLRYLEDKKEKEIARIMGLARETVSRKLKSARAYMRKRYMVLGEELLDA
jgi:RNA polymerase sigma factor (sigma-70 family)